VVKALCLGANAVVSAGDSSLPRASPGSKAWSTLWEVSGRSASCWESPLIRRIVVLEQEILLALRLLGANKLDDLRPSMVEVKE
jgi:isopentenyl diphosphate isomerase/L-lactate dehydrogenase-like FMN-dependent dehydrogenase